LKKSNKQKSELRVKSNETFALIDERAKLLKEERDNPNNNLSIDNFRKHADDMEERYKKYEDLGDKEIEGLSVQIPSFMMPEVEADSTKMARVEEWHKNVGKDVYIEEALYVIGDIIEQN